MVLKDARILERHLVVLANKQQADGGWPLSWSAVSSESELEYRGVVTLNALKTLRAHGKLQHQLGLAALRVLHAKCCCGR